MSEYFLKYFSNLLTNKSVCQVQWVDLLVFVENGILEQLTKPASETHTREQKHILERRNGKSFIQTSNTFMYMVHGYHQRSRCDVVAAWHMCVVCPVGSGKVFVGSVQQIFSKYPIEPFDRTPTYMCSGIRNIGPIIQSEYYAAVGWGYGGRGACSIHGWLMV